MNIYDHAYTTLLRRSSYDVMTKDCRDVSIYLYYNVELLFLNRNKKNK